MKTKHFLLFLFFLPTHINSQWIRTDMPTAISGRCLLANDANLFCATDSGVFLSTNSRVLNWSGLNTGSTTANVFSLAVDRTNLFAGTFGGGVFLSPNNGTEPGSRLALASPD